MNRKVSSAELYEGSLHGKSATASEKNVLQQNGTTITLKEAIEALPPFQKDIIGDMIYHNDSVFTLTRCMQRETLIRVSDSSVTIQENQKIGTQSFSLQMYNDDKGKIQGASQSPDSTTLSLLTSESYGMIANLILIKLLYQIGNMKGNENIILVLDNQEVIDRCKTPPDIEKPSSTMIPEIDVWKFITDLQKEINTKITFK